MNRKDRPAVSKCISDFVNSVNGAVAIMRVTPPCHEPGLLDLPYVDVGLVGELADLFDF